MIQVANPIYDSVFKHLMEHQEVAAGLISSFLGVQIESIEPRPQELTNVRYAVPLSLLDQDLRIFRLDFTAVIKLPDGTNRKVIIELQKAAKNEALTRFRSYLGQNYLSKERDIQGRPLPILAIYLLGFMVNPQRPALTLGRTGLIDGVTQQPLPAVTKGEDDHFFQALTHDAAFIQIPRIKELTGDSEVEQALRLFDQSHVQGDPHYLVLSEELLVEGPPWLRKAFRVLLSVASDAEVKKAMDVEDSITEMINDIHKERDAALAKAAESERQRAESDRQRAESDRQRAEEAQKAANYLAELEALRAQVAQLKQDG
jgi:hypothetical protein